MKVPSASTTSSWSRRITGWIFLLLLVTVSHAAHSRRRIVITREKESYDRVITDFSPEGRLSQVEYGMEASRRGSTIAATTTDSGICLVIHNSSFGKVHRIDHHIWLVTAGLSGDARFLAGHLRTSCQRHRMDYGEAPTTEQVAHMAGQFQHYLTRAGGIRPLGCTALVLGVDPVADGENEQGAPRVFQTDPGGIVEACTSYCTAGKGCDSVAKEIGSIVKGRSFSGGEETGRLSRMTSKVAQSVLGKLDDPKMVDVWTFEPQRGKRGGMQATCYQQVDKDSVSKIRYIT
jgi:20S proteasome alpha/beta subunit